MKNKFKILILISILCISVFCLASCSGGDSSEEDMIVTFTGDEIVEEGRSGIYVMMGKDRFAPLPSGFAGYQSGDISEEDPTRFIWTLDYGSLDKHIPVVTKDHPLVAIYFSDKSMPSSLVYEKYIDRGYTVGTKFYIGYSDDMYISLDEALAGSTAEAAIGKRDDNLATVKSIILRNADNGKDVVLEGNDLPFDNVDPDISILQNLNQGGSFGIETYIGTRIHTFNMSADTRVFQGGDVTTVSSPYIKTDKNYFLLNVPATLEDGYYYIGNIGMFKYKSGE